MTQKLWPKFSLSFRCTKSVLLKREWVKSLIKDLVPIAYRFIVYQYVSKKKLRRKLNSNIAAPLFSQDQTKVDGAKDSLFHAILQGSKRGPHVFLLLWKSCFSLVFHHRHRYHEVKNFLAFFLQILRFF